MNSEWNWTLFFLGLIGGLAPEIARWKRLLSQRKAGQVFPGISWAVVSVVYAGIGGVLAAVLALHYASALYIGCSWPVFFSGAAKYVRSIGGARGQRGEGGGFGRWSAFDQGL